MYFGYVMNDYHYVHCSTIVCPVLFDLIVTDAHSFCVISEYHTILCVLQTYVSTVFI